MFDESQAVSLSFSDFFAAGLLKQVLLVCGVQLADLMVSAYSTW